MALEPFLVNPPKRRPSRKAKSHRRRSNVGLKRHRIVAFENKRGDLFSSGAAKIVRKGIKLNPFRRNPFGEELMFFGANPKGGHMARKKHSKKRFRKNPARKSRRFKLNPVMDKSIMYMILSGGVAALATRMIPNLIGLTGWKAYATQAAILVGGGLAATKLVNKNVGVGVMIGSGAMIITDVTRNMLSGATAAASAPVAVQGFENLGNYEVDLIEQGPYAQPSAVQ